MLMGRERPDLWIALIQTWAYLSVRSSSVERSGKSNWNTSSSRFIDSRRFTHSRTTSTNGEAFHFLNIILFPTQESLAFLRNNAKSDCLVRHSSYYLRSNVSGPPAGPCSPPQSDWTWGAVRQGTPLLDSIPSTFFKVATVIFSIWSQLSTPIDESQTAVTHGSPFECQCVQR
jgi:hypothetical protein